MGGRRGGGPLVDLLPSLARVREEDLWSTDKEEEEESVRHTSIFFFSLKNGVANTPSMYSFDL